MSKSTREAIIEIVLPVILNEWAKAEDAEEIADQILNFTGWVSAEDVTVKGAWRGEDLYWRFTYGLLAHDISDHDIKVWLRTKANLKHNGQPHDGVLRQCHIDAYINQVLLPPPPNKE